MIFLQCVGSVCRSRKRASYLQGGSEMIMRTNNNRKDKNPLDFKPPFHPRCCLDVTRRSRLRRGSGEEEAFSGRWTSPRSRAAPPGAQLHKLRLPSSLPPRCHRTQATGQHAPLMCLRRDCLCGGWNVWTFSSRGVENEAWPADEQTPFCHRQLSEPPQICCSFYCTVWPDGASDASDGFRKANGERLATDQARSSRPSWDWTEAHGRNVCRVSSDCCRRDRLHNKNQPSGRKAKEQKNTSLDTKSEHGEEAGCRAAALKSDGFWEIPCSPYACFQNYASESNSMHFNFSFRADLASGLTLKAVASCTTDGSTS